MDNPNQLNEPEPIRPEIAVEGPQSRRPDPSQEIAPPAEEKLLRAPNFWEKNGKWINGVLLVALTIALGFVALLLFGPKEVSSIF